MLPRDVQVVRVASDTAAGSTRPNAMLTRVNHTILSANPPGIPLTLPGVSRPVQAVRTDNIQGMAADGAKTAADDVWVGEVKGPGMSMSVVTLLTQDYEMYGTVRYFDEQRKAFRSFRILPKPGSQSTSQRLAAQFNTRQATLTASIGPDGNLTLPYPYEVASNSSEEAADGAEVTAAAASAAASAPSFTAQALAPLQDEREYVVVEYREPTKRRMFRLQNNGNTTAAAAAAVTEAAAVVNADVTVSQASPVVHDVLIVYTAAAARHAGGESAIKAAAQDTVARPNKAYADNGLNLRQRLVDVRATGADLVALFQMLPDVCGVAWVGNGRDDSAFSTTAGTATHMHMR
ncbi:hypothetical protein OEZ86_007286 [Tetradesmus obliquus]|nr:hypothetical protein OEZ86_007286 [Tetradesmus obliquus]